MQNNLRALRIAKGLTQKQIAELLGLQCEDRLSHWERGSAIPSIKNVIKLSKVLEIPMNKLFD